MWKNLDLNCLKSKDSARKLKKNIKLVKHHESRDLCDIKPSNAARPRFPHSTPSFEVLNSYLNIPIIPEFFPVVLYSRGREE